jgi:hypothetical protein
MLHDEEGRPVVFTDVVDRTDVRSCETMRASRANRSRKAEWAPRASGMILMATSRLNLGSRAR